MKRIATVVSVIGFSLLTGCSAGSIYSTDHQATSEPIVTTPRVSGGSSGYGSHGHASTVIGNSQTPARIHINSNMGTNGINVSPTLRSRFLNWSFR